MHIGMVHVVYEMLDSTKVEEGAVELGQMQSRVARKCPFYSSRPKAA